MMAQNENTLYRSEKIAKFFGVAAKITRCWCKAGKLPACKLGKEWNIRIK